MNKSFSRQKETEKDRIKAITTIWRDKGSFGEDQCPATAYLYHIHPDDVRGGEVFKMSEAEFDHYKIARLALDLARFFPLIPESKGERQRFSL